MGPENDEWIRRVAAEADIVVAAWGTHGTPQRITAVKGLLRHRTLWCLGTTKDGQPRHPLYIPNGTPLQTYTAAQHDWHQPTSPAGQDSPTQRICPTGATGAAARSTGDHQRDGLPSPPPFLEQMGGARLDGGPS